MKASSKENLCNSKAIVNEIHIKHRMPVHYYFKGTPFAYLEF